MRAYRILKWKGGGKFIHNMEKPSPDYGEVLLKVVANGICQSDLHLMYHWEASPPHLKINLPMTIGHEIAGYVEEIGKGVKGIEKGMNCVVTISGCGNCYYCVKGFNNYCPFKPAQPGMGRDGGLADYVVAQAESIVPIEDVDLCKAAPLTDAGLSSYHAIKRVKELLYPGANTVVIGVGGLGHMAVMILKALYKVNVIAVDISEKALNLAKELGADFVFEFRKNSFENIKNAVGKRDIHSVFDFVGSGETISLAARIISSLGHIVVVGRGDGVFHFKHNSMPYGAFLSTTFGGTKGELVELINLLKMGAIEPVIEKYQLNEVELAFEKLKKGEVKGRAVIKV